MAEIKNREDEVCAAVVNFIRLNEGSELIKQPKPDLVFRDSQAVDGFYVTPNGDYQIVIEHTQIESFSNQIKDGVIFTKLAKCLEDNFKIISGYYRLIFPINVLENANIAKSCSAIQDWLRINIPQLEDEKFIEVDSDTIPNFPASVKFKIRFEKFDGNLNLLICLREVPKELEFLRAQKIKESFDKKCPKLQAAKQALERCESVLILESNDIACANSVLISQAIEEAVRIRRGDIPDRIYLVDTATLPWWICQYDFKKGRLSHPEQINRK